MKRKVTLALGVLMICLSLFSCIEDADFEDLKVEEIISEESASTGNNGSSVGQSKPPFPK